MTDEKTYGPENVEEFTVEHTALIRAWPLDDYDDADDYTEGEKYDWVSDNGESDEYFTTVDEARRDFKNRI